MLRRTIGGLAVLAMILATTAFAADENRFLAPTAQPFEVITLDPPAEKIPAPHVDATGRMRIGTVRTLGQAVAIDAWVPLAGGYVTRIRATSPEAVGLRVKLELGAVPGTFEVRAQGSDGRIEIAVIDPANGPEAWTPWTEGATQDIEIFSATQPSAGAVRVGAMVHFTASPVAKLAASCTISTACSTSDPTLDAAIAERKKSVFRIAFVDDGGSYVCTATLIDTPRNPAAYALTANHCIDKGASAASIAAYWFFEQSSCVSTLTSPTAVQQTSGAQLVFTNYNTDATLLLMNAAPPVGATYAPLNQALLNSGEAVVSISHPRGDTSHWATGTAGAQARDADRPYNMYLVNFQRGMIEPGSSGSGIFTMVGGHLQLRGVLSQGAENLSCAQPTLFTLYGRLEAFYPQIAQYIGAAGAVADDSPNRPQDFVGLMRDPNGTDDTPLNLRTTTLALDNRRIEYAGDVDLYRFSITSAAYVSAWTEGSMDTVGTILKSDGAPASESDTANDDGDWSTPNNNNFGITKKLAAGTYYVHVANWAPSGTGSYNFRLRADSVDTNYTDLWWNPAENGWGLNINHQGNTLFAALFSYDTAGAPVWFVMSAGTLQGDGSYQGTLYRTSGPAFNANPFGAVSVNAVGTMRISFSGSGNGTLTYTVDGVQVSKAIARQVFDTQPTCTWSAFDRATATNYQDLWWKPSEPGWGLNITHQGLKMFATLFTYDSAGRPMWLVMSDGNKNITGAYTGALYRTTGPAFNASPWTAPALAQVGTMTINFANGNAATLTYSVNGTTVTKQIERQAFGGIKTLCQS